MNKHFSFYPDARISLALDRNMRIQLANSLSYLNEVIKNQFDYPKDDLKKLISNMLSGETYPPSTFGLYYQATSSLLDGKNDQAKFLLNALIEERPYPKRQLEIINLSDVESQSNIEIYKNLMNSDPSVQFKIEPLSQSVALEKIKFFRSSINKLKKQLPLLALELESIVRSLILVKGSEENDYEFAGGSCYMLWGALFINAEMHDSEIALIEALAHESAHSLLFGYCIDETLVLNSDEELFESPLRLDLRPMDGIFHATFVSARMYWAMSTLLKNNDLSKEESLYAIEAKERNRKSFYNGYDVIKRHAKLSKIGKKIIKDTFKYMESERL